MLGYLFYSHRCESSANFIRIIQSEGIHNLFNIIDIDKICYLFYHKVCFTVVIPEISPSKKPANKINKQN